MSALWMKKLSTLRVKSLLLPGSSTKRPVKTELPLRWVLVVEWLSRNRAPELIILVACAQLLLSFWV